MPLFEQHPWVLIALFIATSEIWDLFKAIVWALIERKNHEHLLDH